MSIIRKLDLEELAEFIRININAYPGVLNHAPSVIESLTQQFSHTQQEDENVDYYGLFRQDSMLGGMRIHQYSMNFHSQFIQVGGVGSVAVDLTHKKEGVAKDLIQYFIAHFRAKNNPLVILYPFRPDFYKQMGFGYGTKMNQFKIKPESFPISKQIKKQVQFLTVEQKQLVRDCYNRYASSQHGMLLKSEKEVDGMFKNPNKMMVGYIEDERLLGYISFTFKKESDINFTHNDIHVGEMIFENEVAKQHLFAFLHTQFDQINRVVINTQDEFFHFPLLDTRNGSTNLIPSVYHESHTTGVGIMYRVIDVKMLFDVLKDYNFNKVTCKMKLTIRDSFVPENDGSFIVHVTDGHAAIQEKGDYDFEVTLDISDFSSLFMGVIHAKALFKHGLLKISDTHYLSDIYNMFLSEDKPICTTAF